MTQIFLLYSGSNTGSTFPDPGNWNPTNKIECLGSGGGGGAGNNTGPHGGSGGGGGAYGFNTNVPVPSFPAPYVVIYGTIALDYLTIWGSGTVYTNSATYPTGPNIVYASSAGNGTTTPGGSGAHFYPSGFIGAFGGNSTATGANGGGGGGAAGPHGAGSVGGDAATTAGSFGVGGAADNGTIPGATTASGNGNNGNAWDSTHGPGSGGAGSPGASNVPGGNGGQYGGGGGGGGGSGTTRVGGDSGQGIIVLTYTPLIPALQTNAIVMA